MKLFLFLVSLIFLLVSVHSQPQPTKLPPPPTTAFMQYVLRWAPTFCTEQDTTPGAPKCKIPIRERFALHGVWPADAKGGAITTDNYDCPYTEPTWDTVFRPIQGELNTFWEDLVGNSAADPWALWKHEWRKHGNCVRTTKGAMPIKDYFDTAIKINNMFKPKGESSPVNLIKYLRHSGIIACDNLLSTKKEVVEAVQKVFGSPTIKHNVHVTCLSRPSEKHDYLREVYLCTDVDGTKFMPCPGTKNSCRRDIRLPHGQPKGSVSLMEAQGETNGTSYI